MVLWVFLLEVVADEGELIAFSVQMEEKLLVLLCPNLVQPCSYAFLRILNHWMIFKFAVIPLDSGEGSGRVGLLLLL